MNGNSNEQEVKKIDSQHTMYSEILNTMYSLTKGKVEETTTIAELTKNNSSNNIRTLIVTPDNVAVINHVSGVSDRVYNIKRVDPKTLANMMYKGDTLPKMPPMLYSLGKPFVSGNIEEIIIFTKSMQEDKKISEELTFRNQDLDLRYLQKKKVKEDSFNIRNLYGSSQNAIANYKNFDKDALNNELQDKEIKKSIGIELLNKANNFDYRPYVTKIPNNKSNQEKQIYFKCIRNITSNSVKISYNNVVKQYNGDDLQILLNNFKDTFLKVVNKEIQEIVLKNKLDLNILNTCMKAVCNDYLPLAIDYNKIINNINAEDVTNNVKKSMTESENKLLSNYNTLMNEIPLGSYPRLEGLYIYDRSISQTDLAKLVSLISKNSTILFHEKLEELGIKPSCVFNTLKEKPWYFYRVSKQSKDYDAELESTIANHLDGLKDKFKAKEKKPKEVKEIKVEKVKEKEIKFSEEYKEQAKITNNYIYMYNLINRFISKCGLKEGLEKELFLQDTLTDLKSILSKNEKYRLTLGASLNLEDLKGLDIEDENATKENNTVTLEYIRQAVHLYLMKFYITNIKGISQKYKYLAMTDLYLENGNLQIFKIVNGEKKCKLASIESIAKEFSNNYPIFDFSNISRDNSLVTVCYLICRDLLSNKNDDLKDYIDKEKWKELLKKNR